MLMCSTHDDHGAVDVAFGVATKSTGQSGEGIVSPILDSPPSLCKPSLHKEQANALLALNSGTKHDLRLFPSTEKRPLHALRGTAGSGSVLSPVETSIFLFTRVFWPAS